MSHYTVIVVGNDPARQLAHFDENAIGTLPNDRKWDWYVIGGRWTGYFRLRPGATGVLGEPSWASAPPKAGHADQCRWGDVDKAQVIVPFAVLLDGTWHESGSMGCFGTYSRAMTDDEWAAKVQSLLASIADDTLVTLVDCHV